MARHCLLNFAGTGHAALLCLVMLVTGCAHDAGRTEPVATGMTEQPAPVPEPLPPGPPEAAPDTSISTLIDAIARVSEHGLNPDVYGLPHIRSLADDPVAQGEAAGETWALAATHLARGYLDPETHEPRTIPAPEEKALLAAISQRGGPEALAAALPGLAPQHPAYIALRRELLRQRAVIAALSDPAEQAAHAAKIDTLRVNLERWRWLPHDLGTRSVIANIAGFDVTTLDEDTPTSRYTAIFGKTQRQTPNFSDQIEYIIFNPWWEIPESIARHDKLPQFRRDPGAVTRLGYQVRDRQGNIVDPATIDWNSVKADSFPYLLRQSPGPVNALGQVKIMFPNPHAVYLHDTPDKSLFEPEERTFSSGCIRVKDPLGLAEWILRDTPGWDRTKIDVTVASGEETRADLLQPVPVYIVYLTAVSDACGDVSYLTDVYERDSAILEGLGKSPSE